MEKIHLAGEVGYFSQLKKLGFLLSYLQNLVGGFNPSEKYESQIGSSSPIWLGDKKTCSKPPTRNN